MCVIFITIIQSVSEKQTGKRMFLRILQRKKEDAMNRRTRRHSYLFEKENTFLT